ncbi:MAG: glycosyltransferase family 39 protein [Candidatus Omnitrophica bacterium]|nr:glycosyltransferase family 39 protein [Candidatus Omnitrophota bacterium]
MKKPGGDIVWLTALILLALLPRLFILHTRGFEIFHSDQAIVGLMGKHILEGKPMVYFYGQAYMGSLEAFMAALMFSLFGMSLFSLQLAPLIFYLGFLVVNYFLFKKCFGKPMAILTNFFLALSPAYLTVLSMTALGGYPETLFFGSLVLLGIIYNPKATRFLFEKRNLVAFLTALAAGIGFWVNNLILMYFIAAVLFILFHGRPPESRPTPSVLPAGCGAGLRRIKKILFLEELNLPRILRVLLLLWHIYLVFFVVLNLLSFILGPKEWLPNPPFHVKILKHLFLILAFEIVGLWLFKQGLRKFAQVIASYAPWILGFLLGSSPAWLYSLLGGEGMRMIHASSMIYAKDLPHQLFHVLGVGFVREVMGIPFHFLYQWKGAESLAAWGMVPVVFFPVIYFFTLGKRGQVSESTRSKYLSAFPIYLLFVVLFICLFNNLTAGRYLCPLHAVVAFFFAFSIVHLWNQKRRPLAIILFSLIVFNRLYTNLQYFITLPSGKNFRQGIENTIQFLQGERIKAAYVPGDFSYLLTFFSKEAVVFAPYHSYDRYPRYSALADREERVAYLFEESNAFYSIFQNSIDSHKIPYQKTWIMPFLIYTLDRSLKSEKGWVP